MKNVDSMKLVVYTQRQRDRERTFVPAHPGHEGVQIGLSSPVIFTSLTLFLSGILVTDAEVAACPIKDGHCKVHLTHGLPLSQHLILFTVPAGRYFFL